MAYKTFLRTTTAVLIEVDGPAGSDTPYADAFAETLSGMANYVVSQVERLPADKRPKEFSINFALKAVDRGGFAIGLSEANANFRVSMKWGEGEGLLSGLLPEIPSPT